MDMEEKRLAEEPEEADTERIASEREEDKEETKGDLSDREALLKALQDALDENRDAGACDTETSSDIEPESERTDGVGKLRTEIESLKNELATARADLYNFRQRVERDRLKNRKLIAEDKVAEFLPVLDNLDRALCVPEEGSAKDILVGVRMVQRQFLSVLENSDVAVIPTEGRSFDPLLHDAVETEHVSDPAQDGVILCELLRGYRTPDRVLRAAQVRVGKLKNEN